MYCQALWQDPGTWRLLLGATIRNLSKLVQDKKKNDDCIGRGIYRKDTEKSWGIHRKTEGLLKRLNEIMQRA